MTRRRAFTVLVAIVLLAAAGWYFWHPRADKDPTAAFNLSGNVDVHQVELAFRVSGRISDMHVQEGDRVDGGTLLAQLDRVPFENDLEMAKADVGQAQAQLDKTKRGYRVEEIAQARAAVRQREADLANARVTQERLQSLVGPGLVTRQQLDDAEARVRQSDAQSASAREQLNMLVRGSRVEDIEAAQATLDSARARLAKAQTALADTTLSAPGKGIVSVRAREVGAIVQAGQTVYTLALTDPVWIRAYVPQPRLGRIKPGMLARIAIDSMPGKHYEGTVGFISPEAEFTPKQVETEQVRDDLVYRIRVIAADPDNVFRQGMPVTVTIPAVQAGGSAPHAP
jgi:HlyD family secretion protein